jgi:hypothetical protein
MFWSSRLIYLPFTLGVLSVCAERQWPHVLHLFSFGGGLEVKEVHVHGDESLEDPEQLCIVGGRGRRGGWWRWKEKGGTGNLCFEQTLRQPLAELSECESE